MLRGTLAILAGLVAITISSFAIEAGANVFLMRMFPSALPDVMAINRSLAGYLFTMAYTLICVAGGGYVTAWLARRHVVRYALILGLVQAALTIPARIAFPDLQSLPRWIAGMILVIPAAWLGGVIFARRKPQAEPARAGIVHPAT
jgi:hypothetical protein